MEKIKDLDCRTSLFINADIESVEFASSMNFDRVEIYTGPFAEACLNDTNQLSTISNQIQNVISRAKELNLGINAGHDLSLQNIEALKKCGHVDEVSIGHAIMTDSLKYGFESTIMQYIKIIRE
jgi:pyridoxine 5-phosphate synthase